MLQENLEIKRNLCVIFLPGVILFRQLFPKLGLWADYNTMRFSFAMKTMAADARRLGQAQYHLSVAKGDENKELHFEEIAKGKYKRNCVCFTMKTSHESFCAPLHLK